MKNPITPCPKYPCPTPAKDVVQYDEHVFVWLNETGNVGGAGETLEEAVLHLNAYAKSMDAPVGLHERQLQLLLTIYEPKHPMHILAAEVIRLRRLATHYRLGNESRRKNLEDMWAALSAMRHDLNELFPMPSEEADLLRGPEVSVFCAAVVKAVYEGTNRRVLAAVRASYVRAGEAVEDYCSEMPDLAGHGHSVGLRECILDLAPPELPANTGASDKQAAPEATQVIIPDRVYQHVIKAGRAQWGATFEKAPEEHAADMVEGIRLTKEHYQQDTLEQPMHGVYVDGTGIVICHTGTSPNSGESAGIIAGLWNMVHDSRPRHPTPESEPGSGEAPEAGQEEGPGRVPDHD